MNSSAGWCYQVNEIEIRTDSTYVMTTYGCGKKSDVKNYKSWNIESDTGSITKNGEYFLLTQIREGVAGQQWTVKISEKRISFYFEFEPGITEKTVTYKRIKK